MKHSIAIFCVSVVVFFSFSFWLARVIPAGGRVTIDFRISRSAIALDEWVAMSGIVRTDKWHAPDETILELGGRIRIQARQPSSRDDWRVIVDVTAYRSGYEDNRETELFSFDAEWTPRSEGVWNIRAIWTVSEEILAVSQVVSLAVGPRNPLVSFLHVLSDGWLWILIAVIVVGVAIIWKEARKSRKP